MPPLLLHVVPQPTRVTQITTVNPPMLLAAIAALLVVAFVVWAPRPWSVRRLSCWPAARVVLTLMVFFAVLPSVVPYDHLIPGLHQDTSIAAEAVHEAHCHVTPGSCADAPISAGPGQFIFNGPLVIAPAMLAVLLFFALPTMTGISLRPEVRPPLG